MDEWINVAYPHNGILFSIKKIGAAHGWNLKILCSVKEASHKGPHIVWFHLYYKISRIGKTIETENMLVVA